MVKLFLFVAGVMLLEIADAKLVTAIPDVGPHFPLFTFEKNENPQNILVVYTRLTSTCQIAKDPRNPQLPVFDFYWLMNRKAYKRVHPLLVSGIRERLQVEPTPSSDRFAVRLTDFKEIKSDLKDPKLIIKANSQAGRCEISPIITLGESDQHRELRMTKIYSESEKTLMPPFRRIKSVTLFGVDLGNGAKVERRFFAK